MNYVTPKFPTISSLIVDTFFRRKTRFMSCDIVTLDDLPADHILFLTGLRNTIKRVVQLHCPTKLFTSWGILAICFLASLPFLAGCSQNQTKVRIISNADANQVIELSGQAAKDYTAKMSQVEATNKLTSAGRQNEIYNKLKELVPYLFATILIAGVAAWWTQSKYVIAIAITAALGIGLVFVIGAWLTWIKWGMLAISVAVVLWRSGIYQRERDKLLGAVNGTVNKQGYIVANAQTNAVSS